ncbi:EAL domain-containing protein [Sphingomonas oligophenolica]|uniref:EAL domain-containing protein n=1 Tax=Sphingomonas oligophenolica TaxID=301154 RepID=A0A502C9N6_9SPHN|nr:EAL domain-containing protein [Sphingomonas oligophenolica]TPG09638.1 EAL domain-containing protein [Sphingomonas oligophenolica]
MKPRRSSTDPFRRRIGRLHALGLVEDDGERVVAALGTRLRSLASIWPIAIAAQAIAFTVLMTMTTLADRAPHPLVSVIAGGTTLALSVALLVALAAPRMAAIAPIHRNRLVVGIVIPIAAGLFMLLAQAAALPTGGMRTTALVACIGGIGLTAVSIHQVRAASLGFSTGLLAAFAVVTGAWGAIAMGFVFVACLAAATIRFARLDLVAALDQADRAHEGQLAIKMIAEFETHGTSWFWEADRQGRITYLSAKVAADIAGDGQSPVGLLLTEVFRMDSATPGTERTLAFHVSSRTSFSDYSVCAASDDQATRWWSISGRPLIDDYGRFQGFIGSGTDLTSIRQSEAEITRLALFDSLTGLANRQRIRISLDKTLKQSAGGYRPSSLFLMDLDRFKAVNDTLGHQAGDMLLKQVAQRLERGVGDAGLVGRLGGDEFQVLLPGIDHRDALTTLAKDLIASIAQPFFISGASITIGCSIGVAIAPHHGEDAETLTRNADLALYAAKADGRGVHRFFSENMLEGAKTRKQLEDDIRAGIVAGEFYLAYQPVVSTRDERIVGYEALIRWNHPTRGAISPTDFIPVAEESGLIEALGEWVLRTACHDAAGWPGDARVAVNVSPIQFANPALPAIVTSALANAGLAAHRLELEITEGVFLDETHSSDRMFKSLKGLGVRLALDDFGTGYSSLGYLRSAPFDKIKIDQSFVHGSAQPGNRNAAIIKAIVTLADTLGMETTAEGVEIQDEIELLRGLGCTHIQGYVYGQGIRSAEVHLQLGGASTAPVTGHKASRAPRTRMLRSARLAIGGVEGDVRIRNISTSGAMIDGVAIDPKSVGIEVLIELVEDQMFAARVAWAKDGKAGLAFAQGFDLERLNQPTPGRKIRRTA